MTRFDLTLSNTLRTYSLALLLAAVPLFAQAQEKSLLDLNHKPDMSLVQTDQSEAEWSPTHGLTFTTTGERPLMEIKAPSGHWDVEGNTYISMQVSNLGSTPIRLSSHLNDHDWNQGMLLLEPGQQKEMKVWIKGYELPEGHPLNENFIDMRGLPGGYLWHWVDFDPTKLAKIKLSLVEPEGEASFAIRGLRAGGNLDALSSSRLQDNFFPFVDKFGQYMKRDWPGKTHSSADLKEMRDRETEELEALPGPLAWDQYGGWAEGPQLEATGHFRTQKWNGKWWLVDPDGHLFWSHGPTGVRLNQASTSIIDRKHYFKQLPSHDSPLARFYRGQGPNYQGFNFSGANLFRKYGKDWQAEATGRIHRRFRSWGMNTIANWSDSDIYSKQKTPYVVAVHYGWHPLGGGNTKFPDVFHPEYKQKLREALENNSETWNDPWAIGYFVDNELHGWNRLGYVTMRSGPDEPAKQELVNDLEKKYGEIEQLNERWVTDYRTWEELLQSTTVPDSPNSQAGTDLREFRRKLVETYYRTSREVVKSVAPDKLYLGSRMAFHYYPEKEQNNYWIVEIASQYCDVISFNRYRFSPAKLQLHGNLDKPVIIGEFHFGALDRGMLHTGLRSVQNQEQRGKAYYKYIKDGLENPYLVGAHWFTYGDQAVTGRGDGENYQIGLVDVADTPYRKTISKVREIGYQLYRIRSGESVSQ